MKKCSGSNLLSQDIIEQDYILKNVKNFSTVSAKRPTTDELLFLIALYSPKNVNKHPSEMRN